MRNPLKIGEREFKFKKEALLHYKNILNSYNFEGLLNDEHFNDLLNLLEYDYSFDDVSYPIAASLYVGIGFQNLVNARISGLDKVLFGIVLYDLSAIYFISFKLTKEI